MDTAFVQKGVFPDKWFSGMNFYARNRTEELRRRINLPGVDIGFREIEILTNVKSHNDFFERGIACAFAYTVNGKFGLCGARFDGSESISYRKSDIVVTMNGKINLIGILNGR